MHTIQHRLEVLYRKPEPDPETTYSGSQKKKCLLTGRNLDQYQGPMEGSSC